MGRRWGGMWSSELTTEEVAQEQLLGEFLDCVFPASVRRWPLALAVGLGSSFPFLLPLKETSTTALVAELEKIKAGCLYSELNLYPVARRLDGTVEKTLTCLWAAGPRAVKNPFEKFPCEPSILVGTEKEIYAIWLLTEPMPIDESPFYDPRGRPGALAGRIPTKTEALLQQLAVHTVGLNFNVGEALGAQTVAVPGSFRGMDEHKRLYCYEIESLHPERTYSLKELQDAVGG